MQIFSKIDIGNRRNTNQDACHTCSLPGDAVLAVVCDGMGGASGGDIASSTAVGAVANYVNGAYNPKQSNSSVAELLKNAVSSANIEVYDLACSNEELKGMGTTIVAAIVRDNTALICNVGDSRAYIIDDNLTQITRDHSVVQSLIESGKLTPEEARVHPKKNVITRALGVEENVIPDVYEINFGENSKLLLCTDGLSNFVSGEEILSTFKNNDIKDVADILIDKANEGGGGDNITAAVISH